MGQRSAGASLASIYEAFLRRRFWIQAELARQVGIGVPALRKRLRDLRDAGVPFEVNVEENQVSWKLPTNWFPNGVLVPSESVPALLRLLLRLPRTAKRDRMLDLIVRGARAADRMDGTAIATPSLSAIEDSYLEAIEDAARERVPVFMRYTSAGRGPTEERHVSIHKVLPGPPVRFAALCHRVDELKWFRLENVHWIHADPAQRFRAADDDDLETFLASTVDGYHRAEPPTIHRFFVRSPESRWVRLNLPRGPVTCDDTGSGVRVSAETSALMPLARFVVGLGEAARAETPELAALVRELAEGALAKGVPARAKNGSGVRARSVGSKRR